MILKKKNCKIATILPYKESYSIESASAASLWVAEFFKNSNYKQNNFIYGNTESKKYLTKNYVNIYLKNLKIRFKSTTKEYSEKLVKEIIKKKFDIVEIHNRPLILSELMKNIDSKFVLYFHNDPLSMSGSRLISERETILKNVEKLIFVSKWVKERYFIGLDTKLSYKAQIIYPSVNKQKYIKKTKIITYVGKLNHAKGYDIYKDAITDILNKFPKWKAVSIGDENRRKIYINHKRHSELGFLNHKKTLNILSKSEIAVVPSRWDEPFGRVALEATACGCATITSNNGGLTETTDHSIILKDNDAKNLFREIKNLILDNERRKKIQHLSRNKIKHLITKNTVLLDKMRDDIFDNFKLNILKNKLKIVNLFNQGQKLNYRLYNISLGRKFTNGFVRNNHDVVEISDRDYIKNNRNFNFLSIKKDFQKYIIEVFKNYNPDLFFFGHSQNIDPSTIDELKSINKNLIISHWNEDPLMNGLAFSEKNITNIKRYSDIVDHNFVTTHPTVFKNKFKSKNFHFFFIPVDQNIECYKVYNLSPKNDIFYAMSHGVNRGVLKKGFEDNRINFLESLITKIPEINYDFHGFHNRQPIWGNDFNEAIINSKMGLNLSRGKPTKYYTSNRIASILGNGLLTFVDKKTHLNDFFSKDEIIFYDNIDDLSSKIKFYSKNDKLRKKIAKNGQKKYFKNFDGNKIAKYIIDVSLGNKSILF